VDAAQALADLTEISSQIEAAVLFDEGGSVQGSTLASDEAAQAFARSASELLGSAGAFRSAEGNVTQLEASTAEGSLFVVRDGSTMIAASTSAEPTAGLVFYDLKSALRAAAKPAAKPKPKAAAKPKPKPKRTTPPKRNASS